MIPASLRALAQALASETRWREGSLLSPLDGVSIDDTAPLNGKALGHARVALAYTQKPTHHHNSASASLLPYAALGSSRSIYECVF